MGKYTGNLRKMKSEVDAEGKVIYQLPMSEDLVPLNELIGKTIEFKHTGNIYCIETGKKISKTYNNGYSYEAFLKLAACDVCIVQPEKCHFHMGTCREPLWGEKHCFQPHYVYLSLTSGLKVGITRQSQIPTRWVDQGASQALPLLKVKNRYAAGLVESRLSQDFNDKTQWKRMLSCELEGIDLKKTREEIFKKYQEVIKEADAEMLEEEVVTLAFPIEGRPDKFKSQTFDKEPLLEGEFLGIKGQYLFVGDKVINIRRHQGYEATLTVK